MLLESGFFPEQKARLKKSKTWAVLLSICYFLQIFCQFATIRFSLDENGRWVAATEAEPTPWISLFLMGTILFSLLLGIGFVAAFLYDRSRLGWGIGLPVVTGMDVLHAIAWLQILNNLMLLFYAFSYSYPLFQQGTVGSLIESASLQWFILLIAGCMFYRRKAALGLTRVPKPGRMLLTVIVVFVCILLFLDLVLTKPIADLFNLALTSEREEGIQGEIAQAKANNWMTALLPFVIIGVAVPFAEEIFFRGIIQTYLVRRWGAVWGILLSSFWFALVHVDVALFPPLFAIGLALGIIRHRFQSIWGSVILHSLNNTASVFFYFL
ncbi:type II CAAX endopeptidase family protein [Brevibacillus massiliensis]|jgi:hypothetical protein|uniref:type II CAAX endopeptidase family protein n=1 Tax=Brevibacillus massiliensis TaxID=1118054 RepID=UPI000305F704|nr:type II CAAX endopeptidase family protein [Brevibacillus massiliensis]